MPDAPTILLWLAILLLGAVGGLALGRRMAPAEQERRHAQERERLLREQGAAIEEARRVSVQQSRRTLTGQVAEKVAPHLPDFPYDPTELRFLGTPVDYVVFRGLSTGRVEEVVFLEVKSGRSTLSTRERGVRDAVQAGRVRWDVYRAFEDEPRAR